ncbi:MAG TPA: VOC family protein [Thermoanaerobaculia bacterium]|nr:VOC family protein [Thermoanaerobaculia bacterium]
MLTNRSMPRPTVIPEIGYPDVAEAVEWLTRVFGFTVRLRIADHRVQLHVGDGAVVVTEGPEGAGACGHATMVRVEDVDAHCERARTLGAPIVRPPTTYPYGERQYTVEDFARHRWTFSQTVADVDPAASGGTPVNL